MLFLVLAGEVLFNCEYPEDPPDFIFAAEDGDFVPDVDKLQVCIMIISDDIPYSFY